MKTELFALILEGKHSTENFPLQDKEKIECYRLEQSAKIYQGGPNPEKRKKRDKYWKRRMFCSIFFSFLFFSKLMKVKIR